MLLNGLKVIAFAVIGVALTLGLTVMFATIPILDDVEPLGIDLTFALSLMFAIPLTQALCRQVFWLGFRGL